MEIIGKFPKTFFGGSFVEDNLCAFGFCTGLNLHQQKHTPFCGGNVHKRCKSVESLTFCFWSPILQVFWTHFSDTYLVRDSYGNSMGPKGSHVLGGPWKSHPTEVVAFAFRPTRRPEDLKFVSAVEPPKNNLWICDGFTKK